MHSWRVLILPYLGYEELYQQYRFDEPWNSPHNLKLADKMPDFYACPSAAHAQEEKGTALRQGNHLTYYVAVRGPECVFRRDRSVALSHITDGADQTMMVVEKVGKPVHWMAPDDISPEELISTFSGAKTSDHHHADGTHLLLADGFVVFWTFGNSLEMLRSLLTIAKGEKISDFRQ